MVYLPPSLGDFSPSQRESLAEQLSWWQQECAHMIMGQEASHSHNRFDTASQVLGLQV